MLKKILCQFIVPAIFCSTLHAMNTFSSSLRSVAYNALVDQQSSSLDPQQVHNMINSDQSPQDLKRTIQNLKYRKTNPARKCRALMLYGEPGMGKSMLARAIAIYAGIAYIAIDCPLLANTYQNSGSTNLADKVSVVLDDNTNHYIIILDELGSVMNNSKEKNAINTDIPYAFLTLFDQVIQRNPYAFFIGTTNEYEKFPEAVKSRFRKSIKIGNPTYNDRKRMLNYYFNRLGASFDKKLLIHLVKQSNSFSYRDLEHVAETAVDIAFYRKNSSNNQISLTIQDISMALQEVKADQNFILLHPTNSTQIKNFLKNNSAYIIPALSLGLGLFSLYHQMKSTQLQHQMGQDNLIIAKESLKTAQEALAKQIEGIGLQKSAYELQKEAADHSWGKIFTTCFTQFSSGLGTALGATLAIMILRKTQTKNPAT